MDVRHDEAVERIYRAESRRVLASLIRLLGDFDLAEEALHDAFVAAVERWPREGVPAKPVPWLISAGRFKAIDRLRKRARQDTFAAAAPVSDPEISGEEIPSVEDDRLRLIFTCCHPALPPDGRVALTLRDVCGLTTEAIARAYLVTPATVAQRIVRAKNKIRLARIPFELPEAAALADRLGTVLQAIYLVFNEGYAASSGPTLTRPDLAGEAIRLARLLVELLPEPEVEGLLALMLLHHARRATRADADGGLVLLDEQDRSQWDRASIAEGVGLVRRALRSKRFGPYTVQAAIAAVHAEAPSGEATDWKEIAALYDVLLRLAPSPVIELNAAVAAAMCDGAVVGLTRIDALLSRGELTTYHLAHAARADLLRRLDRRVEAGDAYAHALALATLAPERRFLEQRLVELGG